MPSKDLLNLINEHYFFKEQKEVIDFINSFSESKKCFSNIFSLFNDESYCFKDIQSYQNNLNLNQTKTNHFGKEFNIKITDDINSSFLVSIRNEFIYTEKNSFIISNELDLLIKNYKNQSLLSEISFEIKDSFKFNMQRCSLLLNSKKIVDNKRSKFDEHEIFVILNKNNFGNIFSLDFFKTSFNNNLTLNHIEQDSMNMFLNNFKIFYKNNYALHNIINELNDTQLWNLIISGKFDRETLDFLSITKDFSIPKFYLNNDKKTIFDKIKSNNSLQINKLL